MQDLESNAYFILPKPKYLNIDPEVHGITFSSLWTIYVNKYKIKDNALLLSSKFNKHFNAFLNTIPIRDSTLDEKWGEHYYLAIITPESHYEAKIKRDINEIVAKYIRKFKEGIDKACYEFYPDILKSNMPLHESYYIRISNGAIWIISPSSRGFYYGIQSLIQIIEHVLFELENLEEYIILPQLELIDLPRIRDRGISIDLNTYTPTIQSLLEFIPFLVKHKFNTVKLDYSEKFPYSNEDRTKLEDVCVFHHIYLMTTKKTNPVTDKNLKTFHLCSEERYLLPNFHASFENLVNTISSLEYEKYGFIISTPPGWNCPLDILALFLPVIAEILWNPISHLEPSWWIYASSATQLNLFESTPKNVLINLDDMVNYSSKKAKDKIQNFQNVFALLNDIKTCAFENVHLLDVLELGLRTWHLTLTLNAMKEHWIRSSDDEKVSLIKSLLDYKQDFKKFHQQAITLFETKERIRKGEYEKYFQSHKSDLRTLIEAWIPSVLNKNDLSA